ncbi:MAG: methylated-DNA--[protein]-cysteine S-methyltransferase [Candidatus Sulfobium sp.]|jgi:methylated-DNA-[protein]-cysteine S-methyltransferase
MGNFAEQINHGVPAKRPAPACKEYFDVLETPVGTLHLVFRASVLTGVTFDRPQGMIFRRGGAAPVLKKELTEYFEEGRREFSCKTSFTGGSEFERRVWSALKEVPYGETRTYKWLADRIGRPRAFRAVGNALGKNPLPIIFPCHRIIESDGSLGGYSSGTDIKRRLIKLEYYSRQSAGGIYSAK